MSPTRPKLADPGTLIRDGKLRTDIYRVCLDPDLIAEHEALVRERDAASVAARDSLAGGSVIELNEQIAHLLEEAEASTITLVLRALPRSEYRALADKHPPARDAEGNADPRHERLGVEPDGFFNELARRSIVEPALDADTLDILLDEKLTDGQWDELTIRCNMLNRSTVDIPFSPAVSRSRRPSSPK